MRPGAEKTMVAGDFTLEKSDPITGVVDEVKPEGAYSQQKWPQGRKELD